MKELDVLLEAFLSKHSEALTSGAWTEFESFLDQEDDVLWDCIQNPAMASEKYGQLLKAIRNDT
jgi:succinate dehydrogenase flavin-adding protein (antitoxin of CptAB toxin-antitoxin module)